MKIPSFQHTFCATKTATPKVKMRHITNTQPAIKTNSLDKGFNGMTPAELIAKGFGWNALHRTWMKIKL